MFGSLHSCLVSGQVLVSCQGSDTHAPGLVLLWERAFVVFVSLSLVLSCSVWNAACVFHWCEHAAYESPY